VIVLEALAPVMAPIEICSLYVPVRTLNVTGPDTPLFVSAVTAAPKEV